MKILILTERFFPEEFLINDLAAEWRSAGHEVEVLTQVPSYPGDRIFSGYRNRLFRRPGNFTRSRYTGCGPCSDTIPGA